MEHEYSMNVPLVCEENVGPNLFEKSVWYHSKYKYKVIPSKGLLCLFALRITSKVLRIKSSVCVCVCVCVCDVCCACVRVCVCVCENLL